MIDKDNLTEKLKRYKELSNTIENLRLEMDKCNWEHANLIDVFDNDESKFYWSHRYWMEKPDGN